MRTHRFGDLREPISGQIHESLSVTHRKEVHQLRPPRRFAGSSKLAPIDYDVDRTGFTGVRAAGNGNFYPIVGQKLSDGIGTRNELCIWELRHGNVYNSDCCGGRDLILTAQRPGGKASGLLRNLPLHLEILALD